MYTNLSLIFKNPKYSITYIILVLLLAYIWYTFTDFPLMYGNYGKFHYYYDGFISWINILLFPLFIVAWIYRSYTLWLYSSKSETFGIFWWILSIIISWSICCWSSILLAFGTSALTNFISGNPYLPFKGLELKTLGVIILLYALYSLLTKLLVCERKNFKKSSK